MLAISVTYIIFFNYSIKNLNIINNGLISQIVTLFLMFFTRNGFFPISVNSYQMNFNVPSVEITCQTQVYIKIFLISLKCDEKGSITKYRVSI